MGTCSYPGCKKKEFLEGLCSTHKPKSRTATSPVYTLSLAKAKGETSANAAFASLAASTEPSAPYKRRIEHLLSSGPVSGGEELVHNISCLHDTQKANNCTVWYSWSGTTLTVWGLGQHAGGSGAGNKKYSMTWYDGTSKKWTRG